MRFHPRSGPVLGVGGLFGLVAVVFGQCSPPAPEVGNGIAVPLAPVVSSRPCRRRSRPRPRCRPRRCSCRPDTPAADGAADRPVTVPPTTRPALVPAPAPPHPPDRPAAPVQAPPPTVPRSPPSRGGPCRRHGPELATEPPAPPARAGTGAGGTVGGTVVRCGRLANEQRGAAGLRHCRAVASSPTPPATSIDQASTQIMSHTGSYGSGPGDRIARSGYPAGTWAENVAAGYGSAAGVIEGWMGSEGHRENILDPSFTSIGVASAQASDGTLYWRMVLAG